MARRIKMSKKQSKRSFRKGAVKIKKRNFSNRIMRGGIRM